MKFGSAPPSPTPVSSRARLSEPMSKASGVSSEQRPNSAMEAMRTRLRPMRSARRPPISAPKSSPTVLALRKFPSCAGPAPNSARMPGAATPAPCRSIPSQSEASMQNRMAVRASARSSPAESLGIGCILVQIARRRGAVAWDNRAPGRDAMSKRLGNYLIEMLEARGVRHVFGIPGVHNLELYRGLAASGIRHVTGRHEQGLGFMADGYARVTGRPGVCFTITGPGLTNIATAMAQAYGDSIPMVVISSENRRGEIGTGGGFLHELPDQRGLAAKVSIAAERVDSPQALPEALSRVFSAATEARPRPAYLEIPRDVLAADAAGLPPPCAPPAHQPHAAPMDRIAEAARRLRAARAPVLLAGGGALRAAAEVRELAERLGAPLIMTINARGMLPPGHPLGISQSPSLAPVRALLGAADAVLAIGTELGMTDYDMYSVGEFPPLAQLIRIDIEAQQLERNVHPALGLCGDARATLRALLTQDLGTAPPDRGRAAARATAQAALQGLSGAMRREIAFLELIRDTVPGALLVGDSTQPVYAGNLGFA